MYLHHRNWLAALATLISAALVAANVSAQVTDGWRTGFEMTTTTDNPVPYLTGSLIGQDGWDIGSGRGPRVQTAAEIADELTLAGLNPAQTTRSGDQALLVAKLDTAVETSGYFVRDIFPIPNTLETASRVIVDFWARPLTSGLGADPSGTPAGNGKTIGERQGNIFFGISDDNDGGNINQGGQRAAAVRFGVDTVGSNPYENVVERHIDYMDVSQNWQKSGLLWTADTWYNFKMDVNFATDKYDVYVNGVKVNANPIDFYHPAANAAKRFFVSRGTNQAGAIIDDVKILPYVAPPLTPGDFDEDGTVDGNDFLVWQRDNSVGSLDDWKTNFGMTAATGAVAAVPEPAGIVLGVSSVLAGWGLCRRRQK